MNEFNENLTENTEDTEKERSSIFDAPAEHKETKQKSFKGRIMGAVAAVLVLAILVTGIVTYDEETSKIFFFIKIPKPQSTTSIPQKEEKPTIEAVNVGIKKISHVTVTNPNGRLNL